MSGDPNILDPKVMGIKKGAKSFHLDSPLGGSHTPDRAAKEATKRMERERKEQEKRLRKLGY